MKSLKEIVEATRGHNLQSASLKPNQIDTLATEETRENQTTSHAAEIVVASLPVAENETDSTSLMPLAAEPTSTDSSTRAESPYEIKFQLPSDYDLATDDSIPQLETQGRLSQKSLTKPSTESQSTASDTPKSESSSSVNLPTYSILPTPPPKLRATPQPSANAHEIRDKVTEQLIESIVADAKPQSSVETSSTAATNPTDLNVSDSDPTTVTNSNSEPPETSPDGAEAGSLRKSEQSVSWLRPNSVAVNEVAKRLSHSLPIQHANSVLLVTSGPRQRFRIAVEDLALALTSQLQRTGTLTDISTSDQTTTARPQRANKKSATCHDDWQSLATDYRFQQNGQLSMIEVVIDSQTLQNAPQDFKNIIGQQVRNPEFSLWLTDHDDRELLQDLTAACDATLMLIDLGHSSVDDCRIAVTQLREYGSRLLGTVVLSETKGRSSWVKS